MTARTLSTLTQAQRDALAAETFKAARDGEMAADCIRQGYETDAKRFATFAFHSANVVLRLTHAS